MEMWREIVQIFQMVDVCVFCRDEAVYTDQKQDKKLSFDLRFRWELLFARGLGFWTCTL